MIEYHVPNGALDRYQPPVVTVDGEADGVFVGRKLGTVEGTIVGRIVGRVVGVMEGLYVEPILSVV